MEVTAKSVFSDATVLCETQTRDIDTSHLNQAQRHYLKVFLKIDSGNLPLEGYAQSKQYED